MAALTSGFAPASPLLRRRCPVAGAARAAGPPRAARRSWLCRPCVTRAALGASADDVAGAAASSPTHAAATATAAADASAGAAADANDDAQAAAADLGGGGPATHVSSADARALVGAIAAVAVGKRGVKPVPPEIVPAVEQALRNAHSLAATVTVRDATRKVGGQAAVVVSDLERDVLLQRASLLGSLFVKEELSAAEMGLLQLTVVPETKRAAGVGRIRRVEHDACSAGQVLAYLTMHKLPGERDLVQLTLHSIRLLGNERLSVERAQELGTLLYGADNNSITVMQLKALVAHVMRIRHESEDELVGLTHAAANTVHPAFTGGMSAGSATALPPIVLLAEPFDGVVTWDLLTPLLARHLMTHYDLSVILSTGASSGPKYGPNLRDLARELGIPFARSADDLASFVVSREAGSEYGVAIDQHDCSPGLDAWVPLRRAILKRPALATVEKFVDVVPGQALIFIASAFHPAYVDRMICVAEARSYPKYVIVSKGVEGSIGLGPGRGILHVGTKNSAGNYIRSTVTAPSLVDDGGPDGGPDAETPEKGSAKLELSVHRIRMWVDRGSSGDKCFDLRVQATLAAFDEAMGIFLSSSIGEDVANPRISGT